MTRCGPLTHLRVVELEALGPVPFAGMVLADLGADVIRIDRPEAAAPLGFGGPQDLFGRGKRSVALDLKSPGGQADARRVIRTADALLEGHRPGVMERLGLGPDVLLTDNPKLVYGRMTGYGQDGPWAARAGHDANYLALSGVLDLIGTAERSVLPHNLLADFGGGGMLLLVGVLSALSHVGQSGRGQVVDAAMIDGVALLETMLFTLRAVGLLRDGRSVNVFDGAAPFYSVYDTKDRGQYVLAAVEPQFLHTFLERAGLDVAAFGNPFDPSAWPAQRAQLRAAFASRTRDEWDELLAGLDTCATPVLTLAEAEQHPHHVARGTFSRVQGVAQPSAAPRFSRTGTKSGTTPPARGAHTSEVLAELARAPLS